MPSRRSFLRSTGAVLAGGVFDRAAFSGDDLVAPDGATLVRSLRFRDEGRTRYGRRRSGGLDGRLHFDLGSLEPDSLVVANEKFFVRSFAPRGLEDARRGWTIRVGGDTRRIDEIVGVPSDLGTHLIECSGNAAPYALMSAARWGGTPVLDAIGEVPAGAKYVRIEGFDEFPRSGHSTRGAAWLFTPDQLRETGAFFATRMNGEALPADHGAPMRLLVPGWYGCTSIKWVNAISFEEENVKASGQMREFAGRTHQDGKPTHARDYRSANIDFAAMPVRVEEWATGAGRTVHRIVGIVWGGTSDRQPRELGIRIDRGVRQKVSDYTPRDSANTWALWSHVLTGPLRGEHAIRLSIEDERVAARRLRRGYYARTVRMG